MGAYEVKRKSKLETEVFFVLIITKRAILASFTKTKNVQ